MLFFGGLRHWDAMYYMHIAQYGYTYENTIAFFPMFPQTVRFVAHTVLSPLMYIMHVSTVMLLAAVIVNLVCFVLSARALFHLGKEAFGDDIVAYFAAQLYCLNPASIFFSAAYTEPMFALFTFLALLYCEKGQLLTATFWFFLASAVRANGIVNCGFLIFCSLHTHVYTFKQIRTSTSTLYALIVTSGTVVLHAVCILLCIFPYILFQRYAYIIYCTPNELYTDVPSRIVEYGVKQHYNVIKRDKPAWCSHDFPMPYSSVQSSHWNVGFMRYYEWRQIPNFMLALPMVILCTSAVVAYFRRRPKFCLTLGFAGFDNEEEAARAKKNDELVGGERSIDCHSFYHPGLFVYVAQMGVLLVFSLLFMHVQVDFVYG